MNKTLIAYFSASGETARLAKTLAEVIDADLYEIEPKVKYTSEDLNWNDKQSRSTIEMNDDSCRPAIRGSIEDFDHVENCVLCFPIWWYQAPRIIQTFLESYDFSGKTIIPLCTSGGSGLGKTESILKGSCSADTRWKPGKRLSSNASSKAVKIWVESLGLNL